MCPMTRPTTGLSNLPTFAPATTSPVDTLREAALIERCKAGDPVAWETLIHGSRKTIYAFAYSLCHNEEEAGDITGQVFLLLYQNLHTFRNESKFTTWLFRIVRNTHVNLCVRPVYREHLSLDSALNDDDESSRSDILDPAPSPEKLCIEKETAKETTQILARAIHHLPAYQRQTVRMYHTEEKSYEEIAAATGLSIGTVKSRLNRARTRLRKRLAPFQEMLMGRAPRHGDRSFTDAAEKASALTPIES